MVAWVWRGLGSVRAAFYRGLCVTFALFALVLRVLDAFLRVLGGARDGLAEAAPCLRVVVSGEFDVVCAELGFGCAHVVVGFNIVQCGEVAEVKVVVVVDEVSVLVCVSLEEADERERHSVPVVGCHCLAEGVRCAIEKGVLGVALEIGDKREHLGEVGIDGEFLPFFAVARVAQESTRVAALVDEAVDLGDEGERRAGRHRVLEMLHSSLHVFLICVGGHVVCGRSLSDFVFLALGEPHVE